MGLLDEFNSELRAVGRAIRAARKAAGLSQEELADRTGYQRNYIGHIERGERNAPTTTLIVFARALKVPVAAFFEGVR